jgi:hypothetical protein
MGVEVLKVGVVEELEPIELENGEKVKPWVSIDLENYEGTYKIEFIEEFNRISVKVDRISECPQISIRLFGEEKTMSISLHGDIVTKLIEKLQS